MMHRLLLLPLVFAATLFAARPTDYSTDMVVLQGSRVMQTMKLYVSGQKSRLEGMTAGPQPWTLFEIPAGFVKTNAPGMPAGIALPRPGVATTTSPRPPYGGKDAQGVSRAQTPALSSNRLEADRLRIARRTSGEAAPARLADDGYAMPGAFTGNRTLNWRNAEEVGAILELIIPAAEKGRYALSLHLGKYRTFGKFQFLVNGSPIGAPVDFFGYPEKDEVVAFSVDLGEVVLNEGDNRLALRLVGTNPNTVMPDHGACIDWVQLVFKEAVGSGGGRGTGGATGPAKVIEADKLSILRCTSGEAMTRKLAEDGYAKAGDFTGNMSLQWHDAAEPGAVLELALPVEKKGRYAVSVRVARYRTYGIHQFLINGTPLGKPVDMFGNPGHDIVTSFTVHLGEAELIAGVNRLGIRLVGTNAETIMANHGAGLDWLSLTPVGAFGATGEAPGR